LFPATSFANSSIAEQIFKQTTSRVKDMYMSRLSESRKTLNGKS